MPSASDFRRYASWARADELDYLAQAKTASEPEKSRLLKLAERRADSCDFYEFQAETQDWLDEQKHNQERAA